MTLRAETLLSERGDIGEAGCSDRRAAIKSRAAAMSKSVDEDISVRPLVGNHTTAFSTCLQNVDVVAPIMVKGGAELPSVVGVGGPWDM